MKTILALLLAAATATAQFANYPPRMPKWDMAMKNQKAAEEFWAAEMDEYAAEILGDEKHPDWVTIERLYADAAMHRANAADLIRVFGK